MNPDQLPTYDSSGIQSDHDLLLVIHEQVKNLRADIKIMQDGTALNIKDHETRIRRLELWGAMIAGGLAVIEAILGFYIAWHH
jgi:hypothetical protein